jgi:hypothetical protein
MHDRSGEIRSTRAPALREDQTEILGRYGKTRMTEAGQVLFRAGDTQNDFFVVLEGEVEMIDDFALCAFSAVYWWSGFRVPLRSPHRLR